MTFTKWVHVKSTVIIRLVKLLLFVGKDPLKVINMIDEVYEGIHSNFKIGAVFMDHYTSGVTSPKFYINAIINEILKSLQFKVFESSKY